MSVRSKPNREGMAPAELERDGSEFPIRDVQARRQRDVESEMTTIKSLFDSIPAELPQELVQTLLQSADLRIERIVSHGHVSQVGFWYDQGENEWVLLMQGAARIGFEDRTVELKPGDFLNILAHCRHRVEWTTPNEPTIWLAIFYG